jgi:ubiquitin C-terminal hydrolase
MTEPIESTTARYDLSLIIAQADDHARLSDLLENFFQPSINLGYRRPADTCHQDYVFRRRMFKQVPVHMCIPLGRFTEPENKVTTKVDFPMELDITPYMVPEHSKEHCKLLLTGVIWHTGTAAGGHFTTTTWVPQIKDWVFFDDISKKKKENPPHLEKGKWWESRQDEPENKSVTALLYSRASREYEVQNEPCSL